MSDVVVESVDVSPIETAPAPAAAVKDQGAAADSKPEAGTAEAESQAEKEPEASGAAEQEQEEAEESKGESEDKDEKKFSKGVQKKIDKEVKRRKLAEQQAQHWREQAEKAAAKVQETPKEQATEAQAKDGKPKQEDYATHEAWIDALTDWKYAENKKRDAAKAEEDKIRSERTANVKRYDDGIKSVEEKYDDFGDVMTSNDDLGAFPAHLRAAIYESEDGAELHYQLNKNRTELEKILKLSPVAAVRELGKFEAKHISAPQKETKEIKTTKAPAPINPVGAKSSGKTEKNPDEMDQAEFNKWREEHLKRKRA